MVPPPAHTLLGPLRLHATQLAHLEATARDMERRTPGVPRVSRAWALRELSLRGLPQLEVMVRAGGAMTLRAPSPTRGAPRADEARDEEAFVTIAPVPLPTAHVRRLRALQRRASRATGSAVSVATLLRETILLGHEDRERERVRVEETHRAHAEVLRRHGFDAIPDVRVVAIGVAAPYSPPGRRAPSAGASTSWDGPTELKPSRSAQDTLATAPFDTARPPRATAPDAVPRRARTRARRKRSAPKALARGGGDGDDDGPGARHRVTLPIRGRSAAPR